MECGVLQREGRFGFGVGGRRLVRIGVKVLRLDSLVESNLNEMNN